MAKYEFVNIKVTEFLRMHFSEELRNPPPILTWLDEISQDGFKASFRYNPDYRGFSITITDARTPDTQLYGVSSWGGTLEDAYAEAVVLLDHIIGRGSFKDAVEVAKKLSSEIEREIRGLWEANH